MRRPTLLGLVGLLALATSLTTPRPTTAQQVPPADPRPGPAQPQPGICCCRVWSHGWQYSWRPAPACTAQNGTCVSPDHC